MPTNPQMDLNLTDEGWLELAEAVGYKFSCDFRFFVASIPKGISCTLGGFSSATKRHAGLPAQNGLRRGRVRPKELT
jgi:hypothetical protein